jgi:hypothetical protein
MGGEMPLPSRAFNVWDCLALVAMVWIVFDCTILTPLVKTTALIAAPH